MERLSTLVIVAALFALPLAAQEKDPADQIKSKDVDLRLRAVSRINDRGHDKAAALLTRACKDADWEVVWRAVTALEKHGDAKSLKTLTELAVKGPLLTIRRQAARSAARIDAAAATAALAKKLKGKTAENAALALAEVGYPDGWKRLTKLLSSEEAGLRRAAILALASTGDERIIGTAGVEADNCYQFLVHFHVRIPCTGDG